MISVFCAYSHVDERYRAELQKHLSILKRKKLISFWTDRELSGGEDWSATVNETIKAADIILLLVTPDFIESDYCYERELAIALERHSAGTARVIPIIVKHCLWTETPMAALQALPKHAKAIVKWRERSEAWTGIADEVLRMARVIKAKKDEAWEKLNVQHCPPDMVQW